MYERIDFNKIDYTYLYLPNIPFLFQLKGVAWDVKLLKKEIEDLNFFIRNDLIFNFLLLNIFQKDPNIIGYNDSSIVFSDFFELELKKEIIKFSLNFFKSKHNDLIILKVLKSYAFENNFFLEKENLSNENKENKFKFTNFKNPILLDVNLNNYFLFKNKIKNSESISFDVFDTLVLRKVFFPIDLFKLIELELNKKNLFPNENFSHFRKKAEQKVAIKTRNYTLQDIYSFLKESFDLNDSLSRKIMEIEINMEIQYSCLRKDIFYYFHYAKLLNKKIFFLSDMYLPSWVIKNILLKNGYEIKDNLFVSCEIDSSKADKGKMFLYVKEKFNLNFDKHVHFGDNYVSDYKNYNFFSNGNAIYLLNIPEYFQKLCLEIFPHDERNIHLIFSKMTIETSFLYSFLARLHFESYYIFESESNSKLKSCFNYFLIFYFMYLYNIWSKNSNSEFFLTARDNYLIFLIAKNFISKLQYFNLNRLLLFNYSLFCDNNLLNYTWDNLIHYDNDFKNFYFQNTNSYFPLEDFVFLSKVKKIEVIYWAQKYFQSNNDFNLTKSSIIWKKYLDHLFSSKKENKIIFDVGISGSTFLSLNSILKNNKNVFFNLLKYENKNFLIHPSNKLEFNLISIQHSEEYARGSILEEMLFSQKNNKVIQVSLVNNKFHFIAHNQVSFFDIYLNNYQMNFIEDKIIFFNKFLKNPLLLKNDLFFEFVRHTLFYYQYFHKSIVNANVKTMFYHKDGLLENKNNYFSFEEILSSKSKTSQFGLIKKFVFYYFNYLNIPFKAQTSKIKILFKIFFLFFKHPCKSLKFCYKALFIKKRRKVYCNYKKETIIK